MGNNFFAARGNILMKIHCMDAKKIILYRGNLITWEIIFLLQEVIF
jgi:hypothetical protein